MLRAGPIVIVVIDGPAGSGKSTTARALAQRLGFHHLDSGAFYRALTSAALRAGIAPEEWSRLSAADLDAFDISARPGGRSFRIFQGGEELTDSLRSAGVNAHVSHMARLPAVRAWLLHRLRAAAEGRDLVADGRDMGTVVFPDAQLKIFLTADLDTRARRRLAQIGNPTPAPHEIAAERERLTKRDRIDSEREHAPLRRARDAVVLDTTDLSFEQQVDRIAKLVATRRHQQNDVQRLDHRSGNR